MHINNLYDLKTLSEVSKNSSIPQKTLLSRIDSRNLIDGQDYRKLGRGQATILSPEGIKKILN